MPKVVASIEARMTSSRLPGKMLMDVAGRPAIGRLVDRLRKARTLDAIVLATTVNAADDRLAEWAAAEGVACFRGSEADVLGRVVGAHVGQASDLVVEVTGDCTLIDPAIIDLGVETFLTNDCDVVTNVCHLSYPMGMDIQVFPLHLLQTVEATVDDPVVREHVSIHFYRNPEHYRIIHVLAPERWRFPDYRFQLDYAEDLAFIREIYRRLAPEYGDGFGIEEICNLIKADPTLVEINRHCEETVIP